MAEEGNVQNLRDGQSGRGSRGGRGSKLRGGVCVGGSLRVQAGVIGSKGSSERSALIGEWLSSRSHSASLKSVCDTFWRGVKPSRTTTRSDFKCMHSKLSHSLFEWRWVRVGAGGRLQRVRVSATV